MLQNGEWKVLEPLVPVAKAGGRPRSADMCKVLNGIFYVLHGGRAWRMMPHQPLAQAFLFGDLRFAPYRRGDGGEP